MKTLNTVILILTTILIVLVSIAFIITPRTYASFEDTPTISDTDETPDIYEIKNPLGDISKISYYIEQYQDRYEKYKEENPTLNLNTIIKYVNIGLDYDFYENTKLIKDPNHLLVLVNKYNYLSNDYVPSDLVSINSLYSTRDIKLRKEATQAFEDMAKVARSDGIYIKAMSGFRDYNYQDGLYNSYARNNGVESADTYSARAGYSEHQTGLVVDVQDNTTVFTNFGSTRAFTWMKTNARRFGFILRYKEDTTHITGYLPEPWHYRYVGIENATYIENNNLTLEEYVVTK